MVTANLPWIESPFFEEILKTKKLTDQQLSYVLEYQKNGFVVIPGLLPLSLVDQTRADAEEKAFNPDFPIKTQRDDRRIQDFWMVSEASRQLACYPALLEILEIFYGREAIPFQTLNFRYGSQQRAHSDTIHFSSLPAKFMCGVWVALEDITEENGPVFYYPGSQKLPEYDFSHIRPDAVTPSYKDYVQYEDFIEKIVEAHQFEKKKFLAKKGDLLIWSSNIIHGGSPVTREGATRWSQVTHYFFKDCYYYTPMLSNMVTKQLYLRNELVNMVTGEKVDQTYNGDHINALRSDKKIYTLLSKKVGLGSLAMRFLKGKAYLSQKG
ncbi:phytanoyl-CoA dioxygenase family protein [Dyadobacter fermentans]|uniref:Phytanoyl-CoA dioxygenase n=1 Tax=Dyadobacter fermentans (strain ATCC 700827 / DSM 18053 / CIP 107007 / KCTC 52180 / NS114) TaxID=471854 RepID=C6VSR7_DYAFD|nr:phytanoyl-CoA dioxygenase family protein [Dyadobacter fermentans]ACT92889.1 Phytanoyl-CoA dioxygenase [Dyadobacter fermentans DSM 18053]